MDDIKLLTDNELQRLKYEVIEKQDIKELKKIVDEMNRRKKYDL